MEETNNLAGDLFASVIFNIFSQVFAFMTTHLMKC